MRSAVLLAGTEEKTEPARVQGGPQELVMFCFMMKEGSGYMSMFTVKNSSSWIFRRGGLFFILYVNE